LFLKLHALLGVTGVDGTMNVNKNEASKMIEGAMRFYDNERNDAALYAALASMEKDLEMVATGLGAAALSYLIGHLIQNIFGIVI